MPRPAQAVFLSWLLLPAAPLSAADPRALLQEVQGATLEIERAVRVENLQLDAGLVTVLLEEGIVYPATPVDGRTMEAVFLGRGRLQGDAPDEVEAGQLELFTESRVLDIPFEEAAVVLLQSEASERLLGQSSAASPSADEAGRATAFYQAWKEGPERGQFLVDNAMIRGALGDPLRDGYFAARFGSQEKGSFLYLYDPEDFEQGMLGQWVPIDATEKEERKIRKRLTSEQRRGRFIGIELEDLGTWDTWMSASARDTSGNVVPGAGGVDVSHHELELTIDKDDRTVRGRARLNVSVLVTGLTAVPLGLSSDFEVERATDGAGNELFFHRDGSQVDIYLHGPGSAGDELVLDIGYHGNPLQKAGFRNFALRTTNSWYPNNGFEDRGTYDVTFHYPQKFDFVAAGEVVDSGESEDGMKWMRTVQQYPTSAFSFEIGDFLIKEAQAGHVSVRVAFDRESTSLPADVRDEIVETVVESMAYYEKVFGPYPLDYLTVVTVSRPFSQGFLGFITLSDTMMSDFGGWRVLVEISGGLEDRRAIVAHEVAHQWWGNLMGWMSYRDQWLSEAGANYAATVFARQRSKSTTGGPGAPGRRWRRALLAETPDGRSIESLGPLVLGQRLDSSRYGEGYFPIVYLKGNLVLDMLARVYREDQFLEMLGNLIKAASGRDLSTDDFLAAIQKMSGVDLAWFRDRYVYGTGFPEVYYIYNFDALPDGKWRVSGEAFQSPSYRYEYELVRLPEGGHDVIETRLDEIDVGASHLVVPFQVLTEVGAPPDGGRKKKGEAPPMSEVYGRMLLGGEKTRFDFTVEGKPVRFWLDRRGQVLATFYCATREPKRITMYRGIDLAGNRRFEEAERTYLSALESPVAADPDPDNVPDPREVKDEGRYLDGLIHFYLSELYLNQGLDDRAREAYDTGVDVMPRHRRFGISQYLRDLESRMEVRHGEYETAYRRLRKPLLISRTSDSPIGLALLAIAARETGHEKEEQQAIERAREQGIELSVLDEEPAVASPGS